MQTFNLSPDGLFFVTNGTVAVRNHDTICGYCSIANPIFELSELINYYSEGQPFLQCVSNSAIVIFPSSKSKTEKFINENFKVKQQPNLVLFRLAQCMADRSVAEQSRNHSARSTMEGILQQFQNASRFL